MSLQTFDQVIAVIVSCHCKKIEKVIAVIGLCHCKNLIKSLQKCLFLFHAWKCYVDHGLSYYFTNIFLCDYVYGTTAMNA